MRTDALLTMMEEKKQKERDKAQSIIKYDPFEFREISALQIF